MIYTDSCEVVHEITTCNSEPNKFPIKTEKFDEMYKLSSYQRMKKIENPANLTVNENNDADEDCKKPINEGQVMNPEIITKTNTTNRKCFEFFRSNRVSPLIEAPKTQNNSNKLLS